MKFGNIYSQNRRMVVIHHTHLIKDIAGLLNQRDLVFFDDCLFSQYVFLKNNIEQLKQKGIVCVLGFSPKVVRPIGNPGIEAVESAKLHKQLNIEVHSVDDKITGDYINGFMTLDEVKELIADESVYLGLHGCCHLNLENEENKILQGMKFRRDVEDGVGKLTEYGLFTDIFVYPYAYEPFLGHRTLDEFGFRYIFAGNDSKRIPIEKI